MTRMMGMPRIRAEMQGIRVRTQGNRSGNKSNYGENVRIGLEMMNKKCEER